MKIMFSTSPGLGHSLSLVPLIWAARAAGHDVLVGSSGHSVPALGRAGLPVVDGYPQGDIGEVFGLHEQRAAAAGFEMVGFVGGLFGDLSDRVADRFVEAARAWRPDLVVRSSLEYGGAVAAAALGVPAVLYHLGQPVPAAIRDAVRGHTGATAARHGVAQWPVDPAATLDPMPASLLEPGAVTDRPIRFVPYSGGDAVRPGWMLAPPADRPRICVTLGTEVPRWAGLGVLEDFVEAVRDRDVELVIGLGGASLDDIDLPGNVVVQSWLPISEIAPTCAAVVHHGGAATMLTACAAGVPQICVPHGGDQFPIASVLAERGIGVTLDTSDVGAGAVNDALDRVLHDDDLRKAAGEVRDEVAAMPSPARTVALLEELARS